jgi:hypothetical protein
MKPLKDQLEFVSFDLEMKLRVFPEAFLRARSAADRRNLGQITNAKARRGGGAARFVRFHTLPLAKKGSLKPLIGSGGRTAVYLAATLRKSKPLRISTGSNPDGPKNKRLPYKRSGGFSESQRLRFG